MHYKGYKVRIYPNKKQEELIWKHIGASRFIWNYMLALQDERHKNGELNLSAFGMNRLLPQLKKQQEYIWLKEISNATLQRTCNSLSDAYRRFYKGDGRPKFKKRKSSKPAFPVRCDSICFSDKNVGVEKIGKIKYKSDFKFPKGKGHKFINAHISYDASNDKYMLCLSMERESQTPILTDKPMGIDLGIKELAVVAYGDEQIVFHNINKSQKVRNIEKRLKHLQRSTSRKYEASKKRNSGKYIKTNNIVKNELKIKKQYAKLANIRKNHIHQTTHFLVSKLPNKVVMETLSVSGMVRNRHLSKAISEQCFHEFARQMQYKCERNGIKFVKADKFYPSSKTCSCCGKIKRDLKLSDRMYVCQHCGLRIDRDYNAAINLMRYEA